MMIVLLGFYAFNANSKTLDLSYWSIEKYDVQGEGYPEYVSAKWVLSANNKVGQSWGQTLNCELYSETAIG